MEFSTAPLLRCSALVINTFSKLAQKFSRWRRASSSLIDHYAPSKGDPVVVAMSGGVDSSVAAKLLADQDVDLSAVYMRNWDARDETGTDTGCEWEKDWVDVQLVCRILDVPCRMIDLSREYWTRVFEESLKAWESGETPNPDVGCNREIKFGALMDRITTDLRIPSTSWLATGHYARKSWSEGSQSRRPQLLRAADRKKDQTYYLSAVSERSLYRALFPLGDFTKQRVRELAAQYQFPNATKAESMGICFVGKKRKFNDFIAQYINPNPGPIVNDVGKVIGTHQGLWSYTIGQGARLKGMGTKMFVSSKDLKTNTLFVVPGADNDALYRRTLLATDFHWIWADSPPEGLNQLQGFRAQSQFRHLMPDVPCSVQRHEDGDVLVTFDRPQKAIASGQVVAIWDKDWCLGSGRIKDTW